MTTADQLRRALKSSAERAMTAEPVDLDKRARCFIASLSGSMEHLQEVDLDKTLWALLEQGSAISSTPKGSACHS
jgi:hypothetical protein